MQANGNLRSGATEDFLIQARKWEIKGHLIENRRGTHDPDEVVTIEISLQQLARMADLLRHAAGETWFDPDSGYRSRPVNWTSYDARVDAERSIAARRALLYGPKLDGN